MSSVSDVIREACTLAASTPPDSLKSRMALMLERAIPTLRLASFDGTTPNSRGYARRLLFSHPSGFFSVLQLRWLPGAVTPIHGHNAWGAVGVVSGTIGCETYSRTEYSEHGHAPDGTLPAVRSRGTVSASSGAVATVDPDPEGIHRLYNPTDEEATTLHIYGMDLSASPCAINVPYEPASH
jgi:predicted metal-dependent enzyme (double-stranded beta helix superfamily)